MCLGTPEILLIEKKSTSSPAYSTSTSPKERGAKLTAKPEPSWKALPLNLIANLVYKFCEEKYFNPSQFEVQEQGLFYGARGKIARGTTFTEIVYEEAIPIDQEILQREQFKLKDLIESLKRTEDQALKVTLLANPYIFSMYFLDEFPSMFALKGEAEQLAKDNKNDGIKA
ncbi:hypothetical protein BC938DRAFT_476953 [Jimgerdemannia flammicorona]|uniref:Uncharacterized protein n=1 Tax=Jimgerdemannia flammicorona TaxID=994334 RepID=A0A433PD13_9FUNG|nr:hypothetical protein BC938DRAFT_476953 [Jimgerdemannia flammicorona]